MPYLVVVLVKSCIRPFKNEYCCSQFPLPELQSNLGYACIGIADPDFGINDFSESASTRMALTVRKENLPPFCPSRQRYFTPFIFLYPVTRRPFLSKSIFFPVYQPLQPFRRCRHSMIFFSGFLYIYHWNQRNTRISPAMLDSLFRKIKGLCQRLSQRTFRILFKTTFSSAVSYLFSSSLR